MNYLVLLYSPKKISKSSDYRSMIVPFLLTSTLWFSFSKEVHYIFLCTNLAIKFVEFNILIYTYIMILCGLIAFIEKTPKKVLSFPMFFLPYFFTPVYFRILELLNFPAMMAFTISFVHSLFLSRNQYGLYLHLIRTSAFIIVLLVVRRCFLVSL